jgi:hypothetical protein
MAGPDPKKQFGNEAMRNAIMYHHMMLWAYIGRDVFGLLATGSVSGK